MTDQPPDRMRAPSGPIVDIETAIADFRAGRPVVIVDDEDRENEGDICIPAEFCDAAMVNLMATHARGLICVPMAGEWSDRLRLEPMVPPDQAHTDTAYTVSVEARDGVTTGISAADRARTIAVIADPDSTPDRLVRPGHVFPLRARDGGVLVRAGHTEASVDLCRLAGLRPAAVVCEVIRDDGEMARLPDLVDFAGQHGMHIATINDLIQYRLRRDSLVHAVADAEMPTVHGAFRAIAYQSAIDTKEHIALVMGDVTDGEPVLVRVHDACVTGDVFGSRRCDCGEQLERAMALIARAGRGVILYMDQEGRGIGLHNKIRAYHLQDRGLDTVEANEALGLPADRRDYGIGMQILHDIGVRRMRLLTNNPAKRAGLEAYGLEIVERIPLEVEPNAHNLRYLQTKRDKMGHLIAARDTDAQPGDGPHTAPPPAARS